MKEQLMKKNKTKNVVSDTIKILSKDQVVSLVDGIYVGYNISNTLETAVVQASRRMMNQLSIQVPHKEIMNIMNETSVISSGGLNNYFYKIYLKIAAYEDQKQSA